MPLCGLNLSKNHYLTFHTRELSLRVTPLAESLNGVPQNLCWRYSPTVSTHFKFVFPFLSLIGTALT